MLTIKVIHPDGSEEVFPALEVKATPTGVGNPNRSNMAITFERNGLKGLCQVCDGRVFVMNEAGKTVAQYDLRNGENQPASFTFSAATVAK